MKIKGGIRKKTTKKIRVRRKTNKKNRTVMKNKSKNAKRKREGINFVVQNSYFIVENVKVNLL